MTKKGSWARLYCNTANAPATRRRQGCWALGARHYACDTALGPATRRLAGHDTAMLARPVRARPVRAG